MQIFPLKKFSSQLLGRVGQVTSIMLTNNCLSQLSGQLFGAKLLNFLSISIIVLQVLINFNTIFDGVMNLDLISSSFFLLQMRWGI